MSRSSLNPGQSPLPAEMACIQRAPSPRSADALGEFGMKRPSPRLDIGNDSQVDSPEANPIELITPASVTTSATRQLDLHPHGVESIYDERCVPGLDVPDTAPAPCAR